MAELGEGVAWRFHREVGERAPRARLSTVVVGVGPLALGELATPPRGSETHWFPDAAAAAPRRWPALVRDGDIVLEKASRSAGLPGGSTARAPISR